MSEAGNLSRRIRVIRQRYQHYPELLTHCVGLRKDLHDLLWQGIRGNVIICRFAVQQEIAHTPAHQVSLVAVIAESANDVGGELLHRLSLPRTSVARAPRPRKALP